LRRKAMSRRCGFVAVGLAIALLVVAGCGGKKAPVTGEIEPGKFVLEYAWEEGDEFEMTKVRKEVAKRTVMGSTTETRSDKTIVYDFDIESVGPEGFGIAFEYKDRIQTSDNPQATAPADFSDLIGKGAAFSLSRLGYVKDLTGFENLPEISVPGQELFLGAEQYMHEVQDLFYKLPETPVTTGNMWNASETFTETFPGGQISILVNHRYKLMQKTKKKGYDCVRIAASFTVKVTGEVEGGGMKFAIAMDGIGNDEVYFAYNEGMFVRVEGQWKMEGAATNAEMGITVPMENSYSTNVEVEFE
jgi:hypothetical protein